MLIHKSLTMFNKSSFLIEQLETWISKFSLELTRSRSRTATTSKMKLFVIIVNGFQPLTIITKWSILDVATVLDPPLLVIRWLKIRWRLDVTKASKKVFGVSLKINNDRIKVWCTDIPAIVINIISNNNIAIFKNEFAYVNV